MGRPSKRESEENEEDNVAKGDYTWKMKKKMNGEKECEILDIKHEAGYH